MTVDKLQANADYAATIAQRRAALLNDIERMLPSGGEIVLEIGSGHGHFLTAFGASHPRRTCIGIDLVSERVVRAGRKQERARLQNVHFIRAEARLFLDTLPPTVRLSDVYILFPDPWPKLRHHKHRIIQPEVLHALAARAAPECRLLFRTDYAPYFAAASATISRHPDWMIAEEAWPFEFQTVFQNRAASYHSLVARRRQQS